MQMAELFSDMFDVSCDIGDKNTIFYPGVYNNSNTPCKYPEPILLAIYLFIIYLFNK
jgi:hypothetical protein